MLQQQPTMDMRSDNPPPGTPAALATVGLPQRGGLRRVLGVMALLAGLLTGALPSPAMAQPLPAASEASSLCPKPQRARVLELRTAHGVVACDLPGLMDLPARELITVLPDELGIPGQRRWRGVSLRLLVERLGGGPQHTIQLSALNDYSVSIPWSDLVAFDPVLAYQRDGSPMTVRDKGPLMLIYPFGHHPGLHTQRHLNRSIWQVHAIALK